MEGRGQAKKPENNLSVSLLFETTAQLFLNKCVLLP